MQVAPPPQPATLMANRVRVSASQAATGATVAGLQQLGADLWKLAVRDGGTSNVVVSPLSVGLAFSMARDGATAGGAGLDGALHFAGAGRDAAFDRLTSGLVTTSVPPSASPSASQSPADAGAPPPAPIVAIANALFVQRATPVHQAFLSTLAQYYGAGVRTVDFRSPSASAVLNAWVRSQTAGRISKVFDSLDPSTKLVLANAVYFKAAWFFPFTVARTTPLPFTTGTGQAVRVPTMRQDQQLSYAHGSGWQAVELPYAAGTLAMRIVLPDPGRTLTDVLTASTLSSLVPRLSPADVTLALPRWKASTQLDPLQLPGLGPAAAAADFSGIGPHLVISAAVHRAVITVDEIGTEAAAVTAIAMGTGAELGPVLPHVSFTVDRPFAYEIVDTTTQAPLFLGTVTDPSSD